MFKLENVQCIILCVCVSLEVNFCLEDGGCFCLGVTGELGAPRQSQHGAVFGLLFWKVQLDAERIQ